MKVTKNRYENKRDKYRNLSEEETKKKIWKRKIWKPAWRRSTKTKRLYWRSFEKQQWKNIVVKFTIKRNKEFLFGATPIHKCKLHYPKNPIRIDDVVLNKILISSKVFC